MHKKHRTTTESHSGSNNQQRINNIRTTAIEWTTAKTIGGSKCILLVSVVIHKVAELFFGYFYSVLSGSNTL